MATEVVMPQMGESIAEGTITRWLVKVGDKVERDQPLFEISTDKVDAEIPSPAAGVLQEIRAEEGATIPVGQVVATIAEEGGAAATTGEAVPASAEKGGSKSAVERTEEQRSGAPEAAPAPPSAAAGGAAPSGAEEVAAQQPGAAGPRRLETPAGGIEERVRRYSSPLVRKMAAQEGVDLSEIEGTGIHGRVTKQDFEAYMEQRARAPQPARPRPAPAPATGAPAAAAAPAGGFHVPAYTEGEEVEIEPMSKIREITAAHMSYSKHTSAHVTTVFHMDLTKITQVRNRAKSPFFAAHGTKLTYMPFVFQAVAAALRKHKKVNASIDGSNVVYKKHVNIGMAVAMERGLIVPVIRDADQLSLVGLAKTANDLADRARSKKLGPDEIKGGTFTVTNPGVFGSLFGTPIINQPQVAILGIGTIEKRPIIVTDTMGVDAIAIRTMSYFGITYDHRLVDGADADHFMNDVKAILEGSDWAELEPFL